MKRTGSIIAVAVCSLFSCLDLAQGQTSQRFLRRYSRPPTVSPYLDLLRADTGVLPNYQTFVKPKLQLRQFEEQGRRRLQTLEKRVRQFSSEGPPATGVGGRFRNSGEYFRNSRQFFQTHRFSR